MDSANNKNCVKTSFRSTGGKMGSTLWYLTFLKVQIYSNVGNSLCNHKQLFCLQITLQVIYLEPQLGLKFWS